MMHGSLNVRLVNTLFFYMAAFNGLPDSAGWGIMVLWNVRK